MKRRVVLGVVVVALVLGAGGVAVWVAWPSSYRRAYNAIQLDMPEAAVETVLGPLRVETIRGSSTFTFDWRGVVDGEPRHVWGGEQEERTDPTLKASRLFTFLATRKPELTAPGRGVYKAPQTGRPEYIIREVGCGAEVLVVVFDGGGRVIEKAYAQFRAWNWFDQAREVVETTWPF